MESMKENVRGIYSAVARISFMVFCVVMPNGSFVRCPQEGNLISIGPGMYPSNRTLDGGGRSILVLGSCEFMHNGTLSGLNFYVASPDWMILQIWRPVSMDAVSMMLVYERMIEPNTSVDDITQLRFDDEELHVLEGDRIGFTKLNHTFPIPYVFNPQMSADLWYNRVPADVSLPDTGDVITFEEMGFPYHFSVTVTFKAQVSKDPPVIMRPTHKHKPGNDLNKNDVMKAKGNNDIMLGDSPVQNLGGKYWNPYKAGKEMEKDLKFKHGVEMKDTTKVETMETELNHPSKPYFQGFDSTEEIDLETATNQSLTSMLTEEAEVTSSSKVVSDSVLLTTPSSLFSSESISVDSQQHEGSESLDNQDSEAVVTTAGPKYIFETVMQTFSKGVLNTDEPSGDGEAEDMETTSALMFTTSHPARKIEFVTDDVTTDSDDVVLTTEETSSGEAYNKDSLKRENIPNDTTEE